jgi:beta-hydroxylase
MSAASSPNAESDQTGFINKLTQYHWQLDQKRRAFKKANRTAYKITKFSLIALAIYFFITL